MDTSPLQTLPIHHLGYPQCPTPAGRLFLPWHRLLHLPTPLQQSRSPTQHRLQPVPISTRLSQTKFSSYSTNHAHRPSSLTSVWYHFNACMHAKGKHNPCKNVREEAAGPREEACANTAAQAVGTTLVVLWGGKGGTEELDLFIQAKQ